MADNESCAACCPSLSPRLARQASVSARVATCRLQFPEPLPAASEEELRHPLAFVILAYSDPAMLETLLRQHKIVTETETEYCRGL